MDPRSDCSLQSFQVRVLGAQLVECLTGDLRVTNWDLTAGGVTMLCPPARHIIRCLVLVQPRNTCPKMTEKSLTRTYRIKFNK